MSNPIAAAVSRLRLAFARRRSSGASAPKSTGTYPTPYYADDRDRVELITHARAAGRENLPESAATGPNDVETALIREHERRHRDTVEQARGALHALAEEFVGCEQRLPDVRDLAVEVDRASAAVEHDLAAEDRLGRLSEWRQRCLRELRAFMREHRIAHPARYPASVLYHLGQVAVLLVAESIANAAFFARTSAYGLIGGFVTAVVVSLANVGLGLAIGYFARWRHARTDLPRHLALAGLVLYGILTVVFNLGVARLRDWMVTSVEGAPTVPALLSHPLSISFASMVLMVVGLLASLLALRKGWTLDDRVPGHGHSDRKFKAADRTYHDHEQQLRRQVLDHVVRVPEACRTRVREAERAVRQMGGMIVRLAGVLESYEAERERLARWCHQWLKKYRDENAAVRSTPCPAYFAEYPAFPSAVDDSLMQRLPERLARAQERLEALRAEAHRLELEQPERVAACGKRLDAYVEEVVARADVGRGDGSTGPGPTDERGAAA